MVPLKFFCSDMSEVSLGSKLYDHAVQDFKSCCKLWGKVVPLGKERDTFCSRLDHTFCKLVNCCYSFSRSSAVCQWSPFSIFFLPSL